MTARRLLIPVAASVLAAGAAGAQSSFSDLDAAERAALHAEIRALLLDEPGLARPASRALDPPQPPRAEEIYAEEIARDLGAISERRDRLFGAGLPGFGPADAARRIALFTRKDCPACARAEADLRAMARARPLRVTVLDMEANADLARDLGLDTAPSYVLPDMMLRGHIPKVVLRRYLDD
ncbi:thioredoxin domain-containing protein [Roseovarius salinarum]|uniref:glutaredoxin family protein n=1 Tax=Roseovarius salinarum TaxID=1981892 RepID=UPI000D52832D|nr:glutaredoxin family protein [Roseovarius salinarum]